MYQYILEILAIGLTLIGLAIALDQFLKITFEERRRVQKRKQRKVEKRKYTKLKDEGYRNDISIQKSLDTIKTLKEDFKAAEWGRWNRKNRLPLKGAENFLFKTVKMLFMKGNKKSPDVFQFQKRLKNHNIGAFMGYLSIFVLYSLFEIMRQFNFFINYIAYNIYLIKIFPLFMFSLSCIILAYQMVYACVYTYTAFLALKRQRALNESIYNEFNRIEARVAFLKRTSRSAT